MIVRCRLGGRREGFFLLGVDFIDDGGRGQGEKVVLEEELDVLAALKRPPVRPGAVDQVEEGEVGDPGERC